MSRLLVFLFVATSPLPSFAEGKSAEDLFYVALMSFGEGVKAEAAGDFDKAINSYEKAASLAHSANLHGNLANLFFKIGDHGKAILHYRKALLLAPDNRELKANLARVREIAEIPIPLRSMDDSYFAPSTKAFMVNFRVRDLAAMLDQLRTNGCEVDDKVEDSDYGKFGWVMDPEGNRIELWEPPAPSEA